MMFCCNAKWPTSFRSASSSSDAHRTVRPSTKASLPKSSHPAAETATAMRSSALNPLIAGLPPLDRDDGSSGGSALFVIVQGRRHLGHRDLAPDDGVNSPGCHQFEQGAVDLATHFRGEHVQTESAEFD